MKIPSNIRASLCVGGLAVAVSLLLIGLLHLRIAFTLKAYAIGLTVIFIVAAAWSYRLIGWENRLRRITASSMHGLGVLMVLKAAAAQSLQSTSAGSEILLTYHGQSSLSAKFLHAMASTPWQLDAIIATLGCLLLLGVSLYAKDRTTQSDGAVRVPIRHVRRTDQGVHVNVVQVVGESLPSAKSASPDIKQDAPEAFTAFATYDSDLPPLVDVWVGRESEMALFDGIMSGVISITGIGGQGKSSLAAKVLEHRLNKTPKAFWDWRDCREEANRFRTHLLSVIEHCTHGDISPSMLAGADVTWLTKFLLKELGESEAVIVFDNVDHYVDIDQALFVSDISAFITEALRTEHSALIIFTCRPRISYASPRFREVYLRGLSADDTHALFALRIPGGVKPELKEAVRRFHVLTDGHPLWLNIIASQVGRKKESAQVILKSLESGEMDERANAMLRGVWASLNDTQQHVLRTMAELPRAMTADAIYEYVAGAVTNRNRYDRAFKGLKAISLTTGKGGVDASESRYELHPMVTAFIRNEFGERGDRKELLDALILCCNNIVIRLRARKASLLSVDVLEQMTTKAGLELARGSVMEAIKTLLDASDALIARGLHEELFRLSEEVFQATDWEVADWVDDPSFHHLVRIVAKAMVEQGRVEYVRAVLERHTAATKSGTSKYIDVCGLNAYVDWFTGRYKQAVTWAERGIELKKRGDVDASLECEHTRALAWRDSGRIDDALQVFLGGNELAAVAKDNHVATKKGAPYYGNIGRCLFLREDVEGALVLYAKSFDILDREDDAVTVLNRGYAALWIGEALLAQGKLEEAGGFLRLAVNIWQRRALHKVAIPEELWKKCGDSIPQNAMTEESLREWCRDWIIDRLKMA